MEIIEALLVLGVNLWLGLIFIAVPVITVVKFADEGLTWQDWVRVALALTFVGFGLLFGFKVALATVVVACVTFYMSCPLIALITVASALMFLMGVFD